MTDIQYCEPPEPPAGEQWCVVCLMHAKGRQQQQAREYLASRKGNGHDDKRDHWVPWDHLTVLRPARYRAISEVPQLGVVAVCWHHMAGVGAMPAASGVLAAGGPIPPGLLKGRG